MHNLNESKASALTDADRIRKDLAELVGEKRLQHIFAVERLALNLAEFLSELGADIDTDEVRIAALLHDVAKSMDCETVAETLGVTLTEHDKRSPLTLHAIVGARYAREKYGVCDNVFSAIEKHTVGSAKMSLLDNLIFISDYCEETRVHEECRKTRERLLDIRELPFSELVKGDASNFGTDNPCLYGALLYLEYIKCEIICKTVKYLCDKGDFLHIGTVLTLGALYERYGREREFSELFRNYPEIYRYLS